MGVKRGLCRGDYWSEQTDDGRSKWIVGETAKGEERQGERRVDMDGGTV